MPHLPTEIVTEILSLLPVKSVLRCRSVCKTWRDIIETSHFVSTHLTKSTSANSQSSFLFCSYGKPVYLLDLRTLKSSRINFCCPTEGYHSTIHAINGLLCVVPCNYTIYIYNPATLESVKLPEPSYPFHETEFSGNKPELYCCRHAFGFDASTKDYKVVRIDMWRCKDRGDFVRKAQVCTLRSKIWRKIGDAPSGAVTCTGPALVNGFLHWNVYHKSIATFDLASEKFGSMPCPVYCPLEYGSSHFQILNLDGCLSIVDGYHNFHVELWIMKEYNVYDSWTKLIINKREKYHVLKPLSFQKNGELLLFRENNVLFSYNFDYGTYERLPIDGFFTEDGFTYYFPYAGNLVSLKN